MRPHNHLPDAYAGIFLVGFGLGVAMIASLAQLALLMAGLGLMLAALGGVIVWMST